MHGCFANGFECSFILQFNGARENSMCNTRFLIACFYRYTLYEKSVHDAKLPWIMFTLLQL